MIDLKILDAFGSTKARLKQVFTACNDPDTMAPRKGETSVEKKARLERNRQIERDVGVRNRFEQIIQTRVIEGITFALRSWKLYSAVDMAWDSTPISKMKIPLLMYAQGKIKVEQAARELGALGMADKYVNRDSKGIAISIDIPKFVDTELNLIRSVITRRWAAQKNKYSQLWPYYEYESRSTSMPSKCRADVLSQRVDMMADQYGMRHHDAQVMLDAFLYGRSVDFIQNQWDVQYQYRQKQVANGNPQAPTDRDNVEAFVEKEGLLWHNPHPSRIYYDNAQPLAAINSDTGPSWIGYWDVCRFSEIEDNPHYFNKKAVAWMIGKFWGEGGIYNNFIDYFTHYNYTLVSPATGEEDPSKANERKAQVGLYNGNMRDSSVFLTNHFEKIIPKTYGIGDYPYEVWTRFIVANDRSIVYAEFLPSTPGAFLGINTNDSRQVCPSMAHDLMQYQDQLNNLLTYMLGLCQIEQFKVIGLNTDCLSAKEIETIRQHMSGDNWYEKRLVIEYSGSKLRDAGIAPPTGGQNGVITLNETRVGPSIDAIFTAMIKLLQIVDRMIAMSPNEQGQPAPREISATEVTAISTTTSSVYSAISEDIDEYRAAKKRIIYESLVSCSKGSILCPVKNRYTAKTIKAAGFSPVADDNDDNASTMAKRWTVTGSPKNLAHDYIFTSRDGDERPVNTQAANGLVQLTSQILSVPTIAQALGKERLYGLFNEIFRLSGTGYDLKLEVQDGEDDSLGQDQIQQMQQELQQIGQVLNKLAQQTQQNAQGLSEQEQVNQDQEQHIQLVNKLAEQVRDAHKSISDLEDRHQEIQKRLVETLDYKSAPEQIKRQMELQAGFTPAMSPVYLAPPAAKKPVAK